MNVSLYQAAAALNANAKWQELISENIASSSIPGFKKQEVSFGTIAAGLTRGGDGSLQTMTLPQAASSINFRQGEMKFTDDKTDMAIQGSGFFTIQLPDGTEAYTRDGEFRIDPFGQLVTKHGFPVQGTGGPIQIDLNDPTPFTVSPEGEMAQGLNVLGRLQLTEFEDNQLLTSTSRGYFLAEDPSIMPLPAEGTTVRQGYLETANTSAVEEMTQLITAMRAFETNQKVVQMQDERMGKLITELGNPG